MKPPRHSALGALSALLLAENGGDIADEVFILCDALGIERPEWCDYCEGYLFDFDEHDEDMHEEEN